MWCREACRPLRWRASRDTSHNAGGEQRRRGDLRAEFVLHPAVERGPRREAHRPAEGATEEHGEVSGGREGLEGRQQLPQREGEGGGVAGLGVGARRTAATTSTGG